MTAVYGDGATRAGKGGEIKTARLLEGAYAGDATTHVFHDLDIPGIGGANVDHIVCRGNRVVILDSKNWRPGFYWTVFGATRRGWRQWSEADKRTVGMAADSYRRLLLGQAKVGGFVVIHPSRPGRNRVWAMGLRDGVAHVVAEDLLPALEQRLGPRVRPHPDLINALRSYLRVARRDMAAAAGWYPDPAGRDELRYFDGGSWMNWVATGGVMRAEAPLATKAGWGNG